jgi:thiamine-phosphate diphosphorylase
MAPVLCMITDGRHTAASDDESFVERVRAAAEAGAHLVQVREHGVEAGHLAGLVRACVRAVRGAGARVIVNDRLDVALAAGAHGVHLRETSVPPRDARFLASRGFLIGRSVHTVEAAVRLGGEGWLDYLVFGPVFATPSKPGVAPAGVEALRRAAQRTAVPILAIGGIDQTTAVAAMNAGAAGLAAIRWWSERDAPRR